MERIRMSVDPDGNLRRDSKNAGRLFINEYGSINSGGGTIFTGTTSIIAETANIGYKRKRSGRDDILKELDQKLLPSVESHQSNQRRFVLFGLGGSGKTQIALKFAEENREKFWGIFWVDASSTTTIEQSFIDIARIGQLLERDLKAAKRWLSNSNQPWLLVIDNADDPAIRLAQFFPVGNRGTILITTRNPDFRQHATVGWHQVEVMTESEAIELLLKGIENFSDASHPGAKENAAMTVKTLGYIPLAISQAAATIREGICHLAEYRELFLTKRKYLMERDGGDESSNYDYTTYATWEVSVSYLKSRPSDITQYALRLVDFLSCMHFTGISERLFSSAWRSLVVNTGLRDRSKTGNEDPDGWVIKKYDKTLSTTLFPNWDTAGPMFFRQAISLLAKFSLIEVAGADRIITMHSVVHYWSKDRLSNEDRALWRRLGLQFLQLASQMFINAPVAPLNVHLTRSLLVPHIQTLLNEAGPKAICCYDLPSQPEIALSMVLLENEDINDCLRLAEVATQVYTLRFGRSNFSTLEMAKLYAIALAKSGSQSKAMTILGDLMGIASQGHKGSSMAVFSLFPVFSRESITQPGFETTAIELGEELNDYLQEFYEDQRDPNIDPDFASCTSPLILQFRVNFAELYILNNQNDEAMLLLVSCMSAIQADISKGNGIEFDVSRIGHLVGVVYWNLGQKEDAIICMRVAVDGRTKALGEEHALTRFSKRALEAMGSNMDLPRELWVQEYF
ncbi:hypothetical protein ABW19_dt0210354 [Dactylella cylindrospora]|nr:hypothetical protein ABW19_dt0210354 [Dactylella cylindrospora]